MANRRKKHRNQHRQKAPRRNVRTPDATVTMYGSLDMVEYCGVVVHRDGHVLASHFFDSADYGTPEELSCAAVRFATNHGVAKVCLVDGVVPPPEIGEKGQRLIRTANKTVAPSSISISDLAMKLRDRQERLGYTPKWLLDQLDDEEMIWSYLTCAECEEKLVESTIPVVTNVATADEFCEAATTLLAIHESERHGGPVYDAPPDVGGRHLTAEELRKRILFPG